MNHHLRYLVLLVGGLAASCGDPFEPILTPIPEAQQTELVDFDQGALVDPAAYDMFTGSAVRTDQSNAWDFLFVVDGSAGPALLPRSGLLGDESTAGLQPSDEPFAQIADAPDSGFTTDELVPIEAGDVLLMVSRRNPQLSVRCRVFGKLEVLAIEGVPATVTVNVVINPNCERRELIDEEDGA